FASDPPPSLEIIDPYAYCQQLTLPKLIINSTGDRFFLPDSSQFYYAALPDPKYLRYVPNTDHELDASANETLRSFYAAIIANQPWPEFSWEISEGEKMAISAKDMPLEVRLWQASNPTSRDFRLQTIGPAWKSTILEPTRRFGERVEYEVRLSPPDHGWQAALMELTFPDPCGVAQSLTLTTGVAVLPDTLPYALDFLKGAR
ncbi:hypothetical protein GF339_10075, partial [candidate division KSB3 bacterium]|nr:hypothetical protein [candidate division KSB3 bacterium]MBD3324921.1 hypothetical protein [candidate division KSB3 bacterium]